VIRRPRLYGYAFPAAQAAPASFVADFSINENPLLRAGYSQNLFINGINAIKTVGGRAHAASNVTTGTTDNVALIDRNVIVVPDRQFMQCTLYISPTAGPITNTQEMEMIGRAAQGATQIRGYETDISRDSNALFFVRLHGDDTFLILDSVGAIPWASGDIVRTEIINVGLDVQATVFRNNVQILQVTDTDHTKNWLSGNCAIGALMRSDPLTDYGFSAFRCGGF
jgi:hypothetical protein